MPASFFNLYLKGFVRPKSLFVSLLQDERKLHLAFKAYGICALSYTLVYLFLIFGGGLPYKPWLPIEEEVYYRYNLFFLAPSMLLSWFLAALAAMLISRLFKGNGSFRDTVCVMGFGLSIASWSTSVHDLVSSFLGAIHVIDQREFEVALNSPTPWRTLLWILMLIYASWFILLFSKGTEVVHGLKKWQAATSGVLAFLVYQLTFFVFNR